MSTSNPTNPLLVESNHAGYEKTDTSSNKKKIIIGSIIFIVIVVVVLVIVFVALEDDDEPLTRDNKFYEERFLQIPSNDTCYAYSQQFANKAHVAGMSQTLTIGFLFGEIMQELGYDAIYDPIQNAVLDHYNSSQLFINNEEIDLTQEAIPDQPETNVSFRKRSWIAYSASGDHTAPLLYVNNGNEQDYEYLINNLSIDLNNNGVGYIGLAKRGSRPDQALQAGLYGLKGLILFENNYRDDESVRYPNGPQMPNFGFRVDGRIRFGTGCTGNPDENRLEDKCGLDPSGYEDLFPAIKYNLSMIMISPNTAIDLFERMNNLAVDSQCDAIIDNSNWQVNLPINACIGATDQIMANMITENDMHLNDTITNVYGYFEGEEYPDEIVMLGAHRDAWGMGACDDISGTVTILEIARALSVLRDRYGWKPKRSLMFGSWDGEEWGLYGSTDFCENNEWSDKVVAYFNFDMTVVGGSLNIQGNPLLRKLLLESAQQIKYPYTNDIQQNNKDNSTNFTLYDTWWNFTHDTLNNLPLTGCSSDFCAFEYYSGIATLGAGFTSGANSYTYHTFYDLNGWLDIVDPKWDFAKTIAAYGGLMMLKFSQQDLIPFDIPRVAVKITEWTENDLPNHLSPDDPDCQTIFNNYIGDLEDEASNFQDASDIFNEYYERILDIINGNSNDDNGDDIEEDIVKINEILIGIMKRLTLEYPNGVPSNIWWKQLLWGNGKRFPYIWDVIDNNCNDVNMSNAFSITTNAIREAADLLRSCCDNV
eukprot:124394_1